MHFKLSYFDFEYIVLLQRPDNFYKVHWFPCLSIGNKLDSSLHHNIRTSSLRSDRTFVPDKKDIVLIYTLYRRFYRLT